MRELKLIKKNEIDKEAFMKYLDSMADETHWKATLKTVGEQCLSDFAGSKNEILKAFAKAPFNINVSQCNPMFFYVLTCMSFESYMVTH